MEKNQNRMILPTQIKEGMPPHSKIPFFEKVELFYARRRLRNNNGVSIQKRMLR